MVHVLGKKGLPLSGMKEKRIAVPGSRENESARLERNVAKADENMVAPSENGVDDLTKDINEFFDENGGEEEEEDKGSDEENDEWVNEVTGMFDEPDEDGPNMLESLANLVTKILSRRLKADKEEEITSDLKRPGNVPILSNPRVEEEILKKLTHKTLRQDFALKHVGDAMTKCLIKNARVVEKLSGLMPKLKGKVKEEVKEVAKDALNCFQVGAMTFNKMKQKRREGMGDDLHPSYQKLCDPPKEEDGYLFGCDLDEKIKNINQAKRRSITDKKFFSLEPVSTIQRKTIAQRDTGSNRQQTDKPSAPDISKATSRSPRGRGQRHPKRR